MGKKGSERRLTRLDQELEVEEEGLPGQNLQEGDEPNAGLWKWN